MSSLISNTEVLSFTSGIRDHFETFSSRHLLTIIKEPIRQIINITEDQYNGYGIAASPNNYNFIPVSGQYHCMTYEPSDAWKDDEIVSIPNILLRGDLIIKVELEASNYITNGKTNFLIVDNDNYTLEGGPLHKNYLNQSYFYYSLKRTT